MAENELNMRCSIASIGPAYCQRITSIEAMPYSPPRCRGESLIRTGEHISEFKRNLMDRYMDRYVEAYAGHRKW